MINTSHAATICTIVFVVFCAAPLSAQKQQSSTQKPLPGREYRLEVKYTSGVALLYEFVETTNVERTHSDGSKKNYKREVKHFITMRIIESLDGISKVIVNIDSLQYSFEAGPVLVSYDSQVDITPKNFSDLHYYIGTLNRPFTLTINSYGEVSKVEGEQIEFWRDYIEENAADLDSMTLHIWRQCLADNNLLHIGDIQKRLVPGLKVGVDSTWKHDFSFLINSLAFHDKVESRFAKNLGGYYQIVTKDTLQAQPQPVRSYGIGSLSTLIDGTATVDNELILRNTGLVEELTSKISATYKASVLNEIYTEDVQSTMKWKLTGQFQW